MKDLFIISLLSFFLVGCNNSKNLTTSEKEEYLALGDSISNKAQMVLLSQVGKQIQKNGTVGAVDFCNEKAMFLTDSVSRGFSRKIWRLTDKNRNPQNAIKLETDKKAWEELQNNPEIKHLVLQESNSVHYYKSIPIGMPTCLMCHGNKQTDISSETLKMIDLKYPEDKATDYKMGDFRGMWKIQLD